MLVDGRRWNDYERAVCTADDLRGSATETPFGEPMGTMTRQYDEVDGMLSYEAKNLFRRTAFLDLNVHRNTQATDTFLQLPHILACFMMLQFPHESVVGLRTGVAG